MFFPAMERTKDRRGTAPMSACAERALIVTFPPVPQLRGTPSWFLGDNLPAGKDKTVWSFLPRGHRPLPV